MPVETRRASASAAVVAPDSPASTSAAPGASTETTRRTRASTAALKHEQLDPEAESEYRAGHQRLVENGTLDIAMDFAVKHNLPWHAVVRADWVDIQFGDYDWQDLQDFEADEELMLAQRIREYAAALDGHLLIEGHEASDESLDAVHSSSSEDCRNDEELEAIRHEIAELEQEIDISKQYKIVDRLGEGVLSPPPDACLPRALF